MISIIICSRNKALLNAVSTSVEETIGVPYEIIAIDNSNGKYGICKAYNLGAAKAKYDIFCFVHEDVLFVTQNWGQNVMNHLRNENVGLIGSLGAFPILKVPSCYLKEVLMVESNFIHVNPNTNQNLDAYYTVNPKDISIMKEVVAVDGILMITKRNVFDEFRFDDVLLTGFHGYDIEFSLQVKSKYKVYVVFDLVLKHIANSKLNKQYIIETTKVYKKWNNFLPISINNFSNDEYAKFHWLAINRFMELIVGLGFNWGFTLYQYFYFSFNKYFRFLPFLYIFKKILLPNFFQRIKNTLLFRT